MSPVTRMLVGRIREYRSEAAELRVKVRMLEVERERLAREHGRLARQLDTVVSHTFEPNPTVT